jgi:hypothetical protein
MNGFDFTRGRRKLKEKGGKQRIKSVRPQEGAVD